MRLAIRIAGLDSSPAPTMQIYSHSAFVVIALSMWQYFAAIGRKLPIAAVLPN